MHTANTIIEPWFNGDPCNDCENCSKVCKKLQSRISAVIKELNEKIITTNEYAQMGLNSGKPKHMEAALWDILEITKDLTEQQEKQP